MSSAITTPLPIFNITVGTAGEFTNDTSTDISAEVNAEIKAAPTGYAIVINFEPGIYGDANSICLPSNTTVKGDDATLEYLQTPDNTNKMFGLITNLDSHFQNLILTVNNTSGPPTKINYGTPNTSETMDGDASTAIVDSNISVQGMNFESSSHYVFDTWWVNSTNVDVQNNVYMGGGDGNAFVNVVNGIAASNIAIDQTNASYDNWNGPTNITIEDNTSIMAADPHPNNPNVASWSVLMNSTPTGDPNNPGNAQNDAIVNNNMAGIWSNGAAIDAAAISSYGATGEIGITEQGNAINNLNAPNTDGSVSAGPMNNLVVQDNLYTGAVLPSADGYAPVEATADGAVAPADDTSIAGNLIFAAYSAAGSPVISNNGESPTTVNNAVLNANLSSANQISTSAQEGSATSQGNIGISTGEIYGSPIIAGLDIDAPPNLFVEPGVASLPNGLAILDSTGSQSISVTISCQFGTLALGSTHSNVNYTVVDGEQAIVLSGTEEQVNADLTDLSYTSNAGGWDDALDITATDSLGYSATRYLPILVTTQAELVSNIVTLTPGELDSVTSSSSSANSGLPAPPNLSGDTVISSSGNNSFAMGSLTSTVLLGSGNNTVQGGTQQGYVVGGSGNSSVNLDEGGSVTVVGGAGSLLVNAMTGNNLIESNAANSSVFLGGGSDTILGGLGNLSVQGGGGAAYIATLPQNSGNLLVDLSAGNSTVLALSGNATIATQAGTSNMIVAGSGNVFVQSGGNDLIYGGAGDLSLIASSGANDTVIGGSGTVQLNTSGGIGSVAAAGFGVYLGVMGESWNVSVTGADTVDSSSSDLSILTQGTGNVIGLLGGSSHIYIDGNGDMLETFNAVGTAQVTIQGSGARILLDGGADTVSALQGSGGINMFFNTAGGELDFINMSNSSATLSGAVPGAVGGCATIFGGAGGGTYIGGPGGNNVLVGGSGLVTLYGSGMNNLLSVSGAGSGPAGNLLSVGNGGSTLMEASASTTNNTFCGASTGSVTVNSSGSGVQTFFVGSNDEEYLTGSWAPGAVNSYYFDQTESGGGADVITDFRLGIDHLFINQVGNDNGVHIANISSNGGAGGGSVVYLSDNTSIKLFGVSFTASQITGIVGGTKI